MSPAGQRGYTFVEVAIVSALTLAALAAIGQLFGATEGLTEQTRASSRASSEHRRNLEAIANVLRTVEEDTLAGFNVDGVATVPRFRRVEGVDLEDRLYGEEEKLAWVPSTRAVDGVKQPGDVMLFGPTGSTLVAAHVPAGGFQVRQEGATLVISLTTYYATSARMVATTTGETAVSLRN